MQVKLLRALQEREIRRVGENTVRRVNARVLAATNRDLVAEVNAARFRQDLYYRLRVVEIRVPPLRERREDVLPLARSFLAEVATRAARKATGFTPRAANQLVRYAWPGNVRELENAVERAVVLSRGVRIDVEDLPEEVSLALPGAHAAGEVVRSRRSSGTTSSPSSRRTTATRPGRRAAQDRGSDALPQAQAVRGARGLAS